MTLINTTCGFLMFVIIFIISVSSAPLCKGGSKCDGTKSTVTSLPGQWPTSYCKVKNVMFNTGDHVLKIDADLSDLDACRGIKDIWKFESIKSEQHETVNNLVCDQVFSIGHFFTPYYYHGSNYFHLHYDTLIPLYKALRDEYVDVQQKDIILLPGVEASRGEGIDWDTDAFTDQGTYWMQMLSALAQSHRLLPLDGRLAAVNKTICFQEANFGTPKIDFLDRHTLLSFANFMKNAIGVEGHDPVKYENKKPKIGLIHREGRRKILNEAELVDSMSDLAQVDIVDFSFMSVREQIEKVQQYDILIGMNGAGLVNAIYLPEPSVAVQLVPYKAELNIKEFADLLKIRGEYLEWHNNHVELDHPTIDDKYRNAANTVVDVSEFIQIASEALQKFQENLQR